MVLVDSTIWIDHFRNKDKQLSMLLEAAQVLMHPFVIGEIACGNLREREMILRYLHALPSAIFAAHDEALKLLESRKLRGVGIGWVDTHLVTSALLTGCRFWTRDERLTKVSEKLGIRYRSVP